MEESRIDSEVRKKEYLRGKYFCWKEYPIYTPHHHEPCIFCWRHISREPFDMLEGYYDPETENWMCAKCFSQIADRLNLKTDELNEEALWEEAYDLTSPEIFCQEGE